MYRSLQKEVAEVFKRLTPALVVVCLSAASSGHEGAPASAKLAATVTWWATLCG